MGCGCSGEDMQTNEESEEEKVRGACVRGNRFVRDCTSSSSRVAAEIARRRREATILRQLYRKASRRNRWAQVLYTLLAQYARTSTGADGNGTDSGSGPSQPTTCARSHVQHHGGDGIPVGLTTFSTPVGKRGKSDRNQGETTGPVEGLIRAGHIKTV